jgi:hypothetical protein
LTLQRLYGLEEKLRAVSATLSIAILTALGIAVQVVVSLSVNGNAVFQIGQTPINVAPLLSPSFVLTLMFFPVIYCSLVSVRLIPKRIVSPFNIQLGTFVVNTILVLEIYFRNNWFALGMQPFYATIVPFILFFGFVAGFFQGALGFFQTLFVRWFVGLNIGELTPQNYTVSTSLRAIRHVLATKEFRDTWAFHTLLYNKLDTLVAQEPNNELVMAVREHEGRSTIAVVPTEAGLYTLRSTVTSANVADSMLNDLSCRLPRRARITKTTRITPYTKIVDGLAQKYAAKRGQSQIGFTRDIWQILPRYLKFAIASSVLAYAIVNIVFFLQQQFSITIEFGIYFELSGYFFLLFIGELGLAAWQSVRHRRRLDREDALG